MYTFWKRTSPPPTLIAFDAPDRETCTVRRPRTNTPLQALVLMNDPTYVEAARKLAERLLTESLCETGVCEKGDSPPKMQGDSPLFRTGSEEALLDARILRAFRLATARQPTAQERVVLKQILDVQLAHFRKNPAAALNLLSVGESGRNEHLNVAELAAWTTLASIILNLDETVTRG
jgi:hypothetical protein